MRGGQISAGLAAHRSRGSINGIGMRFWITFQVKGDGCAAHGWRGHFRALGLHAGGFT